MYESYKPNTVDTVTIWVYDGVGGDCLATHASVSIWDDTCFSSNVSVTVEVGEYANLAADIDSSSDGMAWQLAVGLGVSTISRRYTRIKSSDRKGDVVSFVVVLSPLLGRDREIVSRALGSVSHALGRHCRPDVHLLRLRVPQVCRCPASCTWHAHPAHVPGLGLTRPARRGLRRNAPLSK